MPGRCVLVRFCRGSAFPAANVPVLAAGVQRPHTSSVLSRVRHTHRLLSSSNRGKPGGVPAGGWRRTNGGSNNNSDFHLPPPWMVVLPATLVAAGGSYYFSHREAAPFTGKYYLIYIMRFLPRALSC